MPLPRCRLTVGAYKRCDKLASHYATIHYPTSEGGIGTSTTSLCLPHATHFQNRLDTGALRVTINGTKVMQISKVWPIAHSYPTGKKVRP